MLVTIIFLYSVLSAVLLLLVRMYTKGNVTNIFKEPIALALLAFMVIHGLLPPLQYIVGVYRYSDGYSMWSYVYSAFLVLLYAGVMTAFYAPGSRATDLGYMELTPMSNSAKIYVFVFMIIPSVTAAFLFFMTIRSFGYARFITDRIDFTERYGGLSSLLYQWIYMSFIVSVAGFLSSRGRDKSMLLPAAVLGIITSAFFGYISGRHAIFIAFMTAIGVYLVTTWRPRISLWKLLFSKQGVVLMGLVVGMVVIGKIRAETSGLEGVSTVKKVYRTLNEAFGNHENVNWLIDNDFELQYGKTYLAGLVNLYPRVFWADKPVGAGPTLKNFVSPGSYQIGKSGISSLTTGMVTESYMNGGLIGVVVIAAITGVVLKAISRLRPKCSGVWSVTIYSYTALMFAYSMTYGEFLGVYTRWFIDIFPVVVGFFLFEYRRDSYSAEEEVYGQI